MARAARDATAVLDVRRLRQRPGVLEVEANPALHAANLTDDPSLTRCGSPTARTETVLIGAPRSGPT